MSEPPVLETPLPCHKSFLGFCKSQCRLLSQNPGPWSPGSCGMWDLDFATAFSSNMRALCAAP
eukprot:8033656-Karenia_brevis.AAC.1